MDQPVVVAHRYRDTRRGSAEVEADMSRSKAKQFRSFKVDEWMRHPDTNAIGVKLNSHSIKFYRAADGHTLSSNPTCDAVRPATRYIPLTPVEYVIFRLSQ